MYHVVKCITLNLSRMIIKVMQEGMGRAQTSLPYVMMVTHVFKYYEVRIQGE